MFDPINADTARQDLAYIRRTLEAAGRFTAVPGKAMMAAGSVALVGVALNSLVTGAPWGTGPDPALALDIWGFVLAISFAVLALGIVRKSQRLHLPLRGPLVRKLLWSLSPALLLGAMLTYVAVQSGELHWLPALWLGCYGAAVANGGEVSVTAVRSLGLCLLAAAAGAAFSPPELGLTWMAVGFGWLHLLFGAYVAWRYHG